MGGGKESREKDKIEKYYGEGGWEEEKKEEVAEVDLLKQRLELEDLEELRLDL